MTDLHKDSQKRYLSDDYPVFITMNTYGRYPYFSEDILSDLLVAEFEFAKAVKHFEMIAYKINPDHVHLIIAPSGEYDYSRVMQFIKRHTSRNANIIMGFHQPVINETDSSTGVTLGNRKHSDKEATLANVAFMKNFFETIDSLKQSFIEKYQQERPFPPFKWQKSFNNWILKDEKELMNKLKYIYHQSEHHNLSDNKYLFITPEFME